MHRAGALGYSFYIYGPKNDDNLRKKWHQKLNKESLKQYQSLYSCAKDSGLTLSFAISPLKVTEFDEQESFSLLLDKITTLLGISHCPFFCLLFDDIPVDCPDLGVKQNRILRKLLHSLPDTLDLYICPSFYSFDPVLEKVFGAMPVHYYDDLAYGLNEFTNSITQKNRVKYFWTGNKVICSQIKAADIKVAQKVTSMELILWDNYPVNDGKRLCDKLFTEPFYGRETLKDLDPSFMHAVNPMCEGALSSIPLATLPLIYKNADPKIIEKARFNELKLHFASESPVIDKFLHICQNEGLSKACTYKTEILKLIAKLNTPGAHELRNYLNGAYAFDPSCLT